MLGRCWICDAVAPKARICAKCFRERYQPAESINGKPAIERRKETGNGRVLELK